MGANVQEEVGLRGAKASTELIQPDIAFVVDCSLQMILKVSSNYLVN